MTPLALDPADWIVLCQSEMAAMAVDREWAEGLAAAVGAWNAAAAHAAALAAGHDPSGPAGTDAPPGSAAGDASPVAQPDA